MAIPGLVARKPVDAPVTLMPCPVSAVFATVMPSVNKLWPARMPSGKLVGAAAKVTSGTEAATDAASTAGQRRASTRRTEATRERSIGMDSLEQDWSRRSDACSACRAGAELATRPDHGWGTAGAQEGDGNQPVFEHLPKAEHRAVQKLGQRTREFAAAQAGDCSPVGQVH